MLNNIRVKVKKRRTIQWLLLPIVFIVIGLGWKFPILGFIVPIVMFMGVIGGCFEGRYVCGNLCPRGAFYDRILSRLSLNRRIPTFFRNMLFRWLVFILLMAFMIFRLWQNPTSWQHWGVVFWQMCLITTIIGLLFGIFFHHRIWCAFCPIGTLGNAIGGNKHKIEIDQARCIFCRRCEKICPFQLEIFHNVQNGVVSNRDCLECSECVAVCPRNALSWKEQK